MIVERVGDLFSTDSKYIGHGINCRGFMRAGIATQFSSRFPKMYEEYRFLCSQHRINPGDVWIYKDSSTGTTIANIASQNRPGNDARYSWTIKGVGKALDEGLGMGHSSLALPRIGSGIGGLEWGQLKPLLVEYFDDHPVDLLVYSL